MKNLGEWNTFGQRGLLWGDVFDRLMTPVAGESTASSPRWAPRVNVKETPDGYVFTAEAPGLAADITIDVTKESLTISGEKRQEKKEEKEHWHLTERTYGSFSRSFTFPVPVDSESVVATTKDGVLSVKVMKSREVAPKKIAVKAL